MHDGFIDDTVQPRFVFFSSAQALTRHTVAAHVDAAIAAWPVPMEGVRDITVELLAPLFQPATIRVDVWIARDDASGRVFGFTCSSVDGTVAYARGEQVTWRLPLRSKPATLPAYV